MDNINIIHGILFPCVYYLVAQWYIKLSVFSLMNAKANKRCCYYWVITLEIDKIEEFNLCHNDHFPFAQLQHGVMQAAFPKFIPGGFFAIR